METGKTIMTDRERFFSYSAISTYIHCSRQYYYRYSTRQPEEKRGAALVLGSTMHEVTEHLANTIEPRASYPALFASAWGKVAEEKPTPLEEGWQEHREKGSEIVGTEAFHEQIMHLRTFAPFKVEQVIKWQIPGVNRRMIGFIDLIDSVGIPYDIKTSGKKYTQKTVDESMQATMYIDGLIQAGMLPQKQSEYPFRFLVIVKTKKPQMQNLTTWRSWSDIRAMRELVADVAPYMELMGTDSKYRGAKDPLITGRDSWKCKYCAYKNTCLKSL